MTHKTSELYSKQFTSQIEELLHLLESFSATLDSESECIKKNLPDELLNIATLKGDLANQLNESTQAIELILQPFNLNIRTLSQSADFKSLNQDIQSKINNLTPLIESCHDKNLANGMSIQILSNINQHTLDLITGKQHDVNLYGSSGEKTRASNKQSNLGKA